MTLSHRQKTKRTKDKGFTQSTEKIGWVFYLKNELGICFRKIKKMIYKTKI